MNINIHNLFHIILHTTKETMDHFTHHQRNDGPRIKQVSLDLGLPLNPSRR